MKCIRWTFAVLCAALASLGSATILVPVGDEFEVNSPCISVLPATNGEHLLVTFSGAYQSDVFARLDADGVIQGGWHYLGRDDLSNAWEFDLATAFEPDGDFVIAWARHAQTVPYLDNYGVNVRKFDASGVGRIEEQNLDDGGDPSTDRRHRSPRVQRMHDGSFLVVWRHSVGEYELADDLSSRILGRKLSSDGLPVSSEFEVMSADDDLTYLAVTAFLRHPQLSNPSEQGRFVVSWSTLPYAQMASQDTEPEGVTDFDGVRVMARAIDESGVPVGQPFQVNTYTQGNQGNLWVTAVGNEFVAYWQDSGRAEEPVWVARTLDAEGDPYGSELVLPETAGTSFRRLRYWPDGTSTLIWKDDADLKLWVRSFDRSGEPSTEPLEASQSPVGAIDDFPWSSPTSGDTTLAFWCAEGDRLMARKMFFGQFFDDFENGDLARWSAVEP